MKRFLLLLLALAFSCVTVAHATPWRVFDNAGVFGVEDVETIEQAISHFQRETNMDFVVLTTDDYLGEKNTDGFAKWFFEANNFGFGRQASGVIYYFHVYNGTMYSNFALSGDMCDILDGKKRDEAHEVCNQLVYAGEYKDAAISLIECATEAIAAYKTAE